MKIYKYWVSNDQRKTMQDTKLISDQGRGGKKNNYRVLEILFVLSDIRIDN